MASGRPPEPAMCGAVVVTEPPGLMVSDCPICELPSKSPAFMTRLPPFTIVLPAKLTEVDG